MDDSDERKRIIADLVQALQEDCIGLSVAQLKQRVEDLARKRRLKDDDNQRKRLAISSQLRVDNRNASSAKYVIDVTGTIDVMVLKDDGDFPVGVAAAAAAAAAAPPLSEIDSDADKGDGNQIESVDNAEIPIRDGRRINACDNDDYDDGGSFDGSGTEADSTEDDAARDDPDDDDYTNNDDSGGDGGGGDDDGDGGGGDDNGGSDDDDDGSYETDDDDDDNHQVYDPRLWKFRRLSEAIIANSNGAVNWEEAHLQWFIVSVYRAPPTQCVCTTPIKKHCKIRNIFNLNTLVIGCVCLQRFCQGDDTLYRPDREAAFADAADVYRFNGSLVSIKDHTVLQIELAQENTDSQLLSTAGIVLAHRLAIFTSFEAKEYTKLKAQKKRLHELDRNQWATASLLNKRVIAGFAESRPLCHCHPLRLPAAPYFVGWKVYYRCLHEPDGNGCGFQERAPWDDLLEKVAERKKVREQNARIRRGSQMNAVVAAVPVVDSSAAAAAAAVIADPDDDDDDNAADVRE